MAKATVSRIEGDMAVYAKDKATSETFWLKFIEADFADSRDHFDRAHEAATKLRAALKQLQVRARTFN